MKGFSFTRKRFDAMPIHRRHKWICSWLRENYIEVLNDRFNEKSLAVFHRQYLQILEWLGENNDIEMPITKKRWIQLISDRFHAHQEQTGLGLAEPDFLPVVLTNDRPFEGKWKPRIGYNVALDNLRSAFNVGSIIRVVDATGLGSVMLSSKTPGRENPRVIKTAMGSEKWIPISNHHSLAAEIRHQKMEGKKIIGLETVDNAHKYIEYPWPREGVVVVGNEEYGISDEVLKVCDDFVFLPMNGFKNSINVANAFAVVAFHLQHILD